MDMRLHPPPALLRAYGIIGFFSRERPSQSLNALPLRWKCFVLLAYSILMPLCLHVGAMIAVSHAICYN
jgi:hypothetical protein